MSAARKHLEQARQWLDQTGLLKLPGADVDFVEQGEQTVLRIFFESVYEGSHYILPAQRTGDERSWRVVTLSQGSVTHHAPTATGAVRFVAGNTIVCSDVIKTQEAALVDSLQKDGHIYDAYRFGSRLILVHRVEAANRIEEAALLPFGGGRFLVRRQNRQGQDGQTWYAGPKRSFERLSNDEVRRLNKAADW